MATSSLAISDLTLRRFVLGQQGLHPGRRWQGPAGVLQALRAGSVVQVDPLNVVAHSHDIVLSSRVLGYRPAWLDELLYTRRQAFDYGGNVRIFPMDELPYWRAIMPRKLQEKRWLAFAAEHGEVIAQVREAVAARGPLRSRDLESRKLGRPSGSFRTSKTAGLALYYLWLGGELMTHSRRGADRLYDLTERVAPAEFRQPVPVEQAEVYFARRAFDHFGVFTLRNWRLWFAADILRPVTKDEAAARLEALVSAGEVAPVTLESDPRIPRYVRAAHLPHLEALQAGQLPEDWQPLETSTQQEMTFLAPLEIVSTRGRAQALFGFEYLWEVYKPAQKRRWGYYTLPILYGDDLVARFDSKLDREAGVLNLLGFWLEDGAALDEVFGQALAAGFRRFLAFIEATKLDAHGHLPEDVTARIHG